jgi:hypothetical protein
MKKPICFLVLLVLPALVQAQALLPFTIKGRIGTLSAPATVYLLHEGRIEEKAPLDQGTFELHGTMSAPQPGMLLLSRTGRLADAWTARPPERIFFFLDRGPLIVTSRDSLQHAQLSGSPLTAEYERWQVLRRPLNQALFRVQQQRAALLAQGASLAAVQPLTQQVTDLTHQVNQQQAAYIRAHPDSYVSLAVLQELGGLVPQDAQVAPSTTT